jgi:transcriptional regulator with XRE-family HTH domain
MTKLPDPVDRYVGNRVRMRRVDIDMSQEQLAAMIGLTFQQIQKYEKGINRISSSKLAGISQALSVSVAWLFEGAPGKHNSSQTPVETTVLDFMATRDGLSIARNFPQLKDPAMRRSFLNLVEAIAANGGGALH